VVIYVMSQAQVDAKARRFIRDHRLEPFVFLLDPDDEVIDRYGIRKTKLEEAIEKGVPHPTTYIVDSSGAIRFKDTRRDFRTWLSAEVLREALAGAQPTLAK
jgi:peroxiredoxin